MSPQGFDKRVDEEWKERVQREKEGEPPRPQPESQRPPGEPVSSRTGKARGESEEPLAKKEESPPTDFGTFVSSLTMQAMVALGEIPHPSTRRPEIDLDQARYLIDWLGILQAKTKGNLNPEEAELLEGALYELRMKFVSRKEAP